MANKDTSKQWFETGDKPTQAQFAQVFDWLRWKDEPINPADPGLAAALTLKLDKLTFDSFEQGQLILVDADTSYVIPINYLLEKVILLPGGDCNLKIGTTLGGEEIMPEQEILSATGGVLVLNVFAIAAKTIYFTGIPAGSKLIILKRKIKTS